MPRHFLQGFRVVAHPETSQPWLVPVGLEKWHPQTKAAPGVRTSITSYLLPRQDMLQIFGIARKDSRYNLGQKTLLRRAVQYTRGLSEVLNRAAWRDDMPSFLPELMTRRIVEGLLYYANLTESEGRKYLTRCQTWEEVKQHHHRGCLLFLGQDTAPSFSEADSESGPIALPSMPRLSTMDIEGVRFGRKLAVHDLRAVLGDEHLARLRNESPLLRRGSLFLLARMRTINLQLMLWKLQGYLPHAEEIADVSDAAETPEEADTPLAKD